MPSKTELPDYAKEPWPEPSSSPTSRPEPRQAPQPDPLATQISETHEGVQALQVLLEKPEDPSKIDIAIDLLETISGQLKTLNQGLDLLFYRQNELFRTMALKIPAPPKRED